MTEREAYIALNMVQGIGSATVAKGVAKFGSAVAFFSAGAERLAKVGRMSPTTAETVARAFATLDWRQEMAQADEYSVSFLTPADSDYPELLQAIPNPPLALYLTGDPAALLHSAIAIVGTRAPTTYGRTNAKTFAFRLAQAGITVVSGLARGVDTEAHAGALLAGGRTVAVIGSALNRLYPAENRELARKIIGNGGAVISEYPFNRAADRQTFPMRNRIISGLCGAVLIVEAGTTSGTIITADHALEQGRSVMAIPGRIDNESSQGCHRLIKDGARLVETPEEVLDELQALPSIASPPHQKNRAAPPRPTSSSAHPTPKSRTNPALDEIELKILSLLNIEDMTPDALVNASGLPPSQIGPRLIGLEMKCQIERLPGNVLHVRRS